MAGPSSKVASRIADGIKRFQPIIASALARDIGESDTVTIVTEILNDVFGYDKFSEITSEYAIRGTYCDLATKVGTEIYQLIEVKPVGSDLKDSHIKQAVDYATNQGVDWVVLTNAARWMVFKVTFAKPISHELVTTIEFGTISHRQSKDIEQLYLISKEGWQKSAIAEYHTQKQALSRFCLGAMLLTDPILQAIRRELRKISPDVRIDVDEISNVLANEVIKREVMEGEKAVDAKKKIARTANKIAKAKLAEVGGEKDCGEKSAASFSG